MDLFVRICLIIIIAIGVLLIGLYLKDKKIEREYLAQENKNLQLQVMTGQIRPHFILNTLGAIRTLIPQDPERASELLYEFSKYIRKNMEQKDYSKPIPFLEEIDYIETYLSLETLRFGEKLHVEYDIMEDGFWILPLTIQPFVENAVKHGLLPKKNGGTVWISTKKTGTYIEVEIRDDGVGFDTKEFWTGLKQRKTVGMKSALFRLKYEMHATYDIQSSMEPDKSGTCVKIRIPEKR